MNSNVINIGLFVEDDERANYLNLVIKGIRKKLVTFNFKDLSNKYINLDGFDLLIFDLAALPIPDYLSVLTLRKEKDLNSIPFLYIINERQLSEAEKLQVDKPCSILLDPFSEIEIESIVDNLSALSELKKKQGIQAEIIKGEKKLIYQIDKILQLEVLNNTASIDEFYFKLQQKIVNKIELTFSAEKAIFLSYDAEQRVLVLKEFETSAVELKNEFPFTISSSQIGTAIDNNIPLIMNKEILLDPFIQELEEYSGIEISSLLLVPVYTLHQPRGVLLIINKLHERSFTESDLAIGLIVLSKINYYLEEIYLKGLPVSNLSDIISPGILLESEDSETRICTDILQSIGFGILIFNHKYQLLFANNFAKATLSIKDIKKLTLDKVLGAEAFTIINNLLRKKDIPLLRQEILVSHPEKRQLYLGYSIYSISPKAPSNIYAFTFMEISQTKQLQAEIIRMDRMASLGVLGSGIAHEIRNPLAGIKAMAQTLQEELDEKDTKNEYIERIVRQVNRLDELLKSFFSYAKPQRPNPVRSKIPDIVREVLPLFRRKIKDSNIIIKEVYSRDLKDIFVDFHQIEQVFFNLIINAIDAMKDGGTLTIRARLPEETQPMIDRRQRIPKLFSDIYNEITISDTGVGMDTETLNNIYNPFFTTKPNGTGLGLSIVYQIILEHGGQITVDSVKHKGTTFKILLPVYVKEQDQEKEEQE